MVKWFSKKLDRWAYGRLVLFVGTKRAYTGDREIDQLYEIEDFLANIGEHKRAAQVRNARIFCKYRIDNERTGYG